ncbi:hypothetical protein HYH38_16250 [Clostridium botulinum]|uniref:Glucan-binding repeat containing, putative cell wall binding protein n=1 Tax=Clostridium botulinum TaxID=1491 RepID=A0A126JI57_CLOBO|nr:hypothetical protein [Clostridium botulinum]ALT05431.1 glucan-binding repeat containing, putative cell wall binding protein [Clostridium botulinum]ALT05529.1 glucan-binding repeat containing, putative cell wall binding protein [Clostridium botulinum]MBY6811015.1 hypothetical protein [Clostridium botulinum]MBY6818492.1 hypothetical protein [Clostridium botulinum]MBY6824483.1 hypothetical protein [Clostridium botulinum]
MTKNKILKTLALTLALTSACALTPRIANAEGQAYWKSINNNWYYLDSTGKTQTGWVQDNGQWYYIGSNGVMQTGWIQDGGKWYYLWSDGSMASNTTVNNYTLGANGAWEVSGTSAFKWIDAQGNHDFRYDIAQRTDDEKAGNELINYNIELSEEDKYNLKTLTYNISNETVYLSEAKSQCIGKTIGNKVITDIKFYKEVFKNTQGISPINRINTIKSSDIYKYKSTSPYVYDEFLIFSGINDRNSEWECMRVIIEFR